MCQTYHGIKVEWLDLTSQDARTLISRWKLDALCTFSNITKFNLSKFSQIPPHPNIFTSSSRGERISQSVLIVCLHYCSYLETDFGGHVSQQLWLVTKFITMSVGEAPTCRSPNCLTRDIAPPLPKSPSLHPPLFSPPSLSAPPPHTLGRPKKSFF